MLFFKKSEFLSSTNRQKTGGLSQKIDANFVCNF